MRIARFFALCLPLLFAVPKPAGAASVIIDLSEHQISITSSFRGADLLLFGAIRYDDADREPVLPDDIVVAVRGPAEPVLVRRKSRIAGIWVNRDSATFSELPGYYAILSTRKLADIAPPAVLDRHNLGLAHLHPALADPAAAPADGIAPYALALDRIRSRQALFVQGEGGISRVGGNLFRADVHFPASVPEGAYTAEIYLIRAGTVIYAQTVPLFIDKTGFERGVYRLAHNHAELYGLLAVFIASLLGWAGAALFQRR